MPGGGEGVKLLSASGLGGSSRPDAPPRIGIVSRRARDFRPSCVRLSFLGRSRRPFALECAVALDGRGGALLGSHPHGESGPR